MQTYSRIIPPDLALPLVLFQICFITVGCAMRNALVLRLIETGILIIVYLLVLTARFQIQVIFTNTMELI